MNILRRLTCVLCSALLFVQASQWTIENPAGNLPGMVWGHTLTLLPDSSPSQALLCGGTNRAGQVIGGCFLINASTWASSIGFSSSVFLNRSDHTTAIYGNFLIAYGGNVTSSPELRAQPVIYRLSDRSVVANPSFTGTVPPARWGHAAVQLRARQSAWIIFGGVGDENVDNLGDVAMLDLGDGRTPSFAWRDVVIGGTVQPSARHYHACAAYGSLGLVMTGGTTVVGEGLSDTYLLSCVISGSVVCTWATLLAVRSKPMFGHVAFVSETTLTIYGGSIPSSTQGGQVRTLVCDATNLLWTDESPTGSWLGTPFRSSGVTLDPESSVNNQQLLVYGGRSIDTFTSVTPHFLALLQQDAVPPARSFNMLPVYIVAVVLAVVVVASVVFFWIRYNKARASSALLDTGEMSEEKTPLFKANTSAGRSGLYNAVEPPRRGVPQTTPGGFDAADDPMDPMLETDEQGLDDGSIVDSDDDLQFRFT